jgi:phage FluMu gp28-like protein
VLRKEEFAPGCKTDCEDALLILPGRKRIRSEPSFALNQVNNEHNDGNHEQKMDQSAANVADEAQKPEHH